jgi:exosortase A
LNQSAETIPASFPEVASPERWAWLQSLLLAGALSLLYYRILAGMAFKWWNDPNYSHGFIVPLFCAWVIWKQRKQILEIPAKPSWLGLPIIAVSLGILVLGELGAENFLSRTSLLFLLAGMMIQFRGWRFFRGVLFPWAVAFFMVPLPAIIFNQIAVPLQFQASRLASGLLALVGVPVFREGNVIQLPSLTLDVVEACSGLRSLVSLLVLATIYGYLFETRIFRRILLIAAAVPIAVVANGVRIMGSGILGQYWDPDKAEGFFHLFSGWLVFVLSLVFIVLLHAVLSLTDRRARAERAA